jgi:predicted kinase
MSRALVVLMGLPGCGKTTLARWIAANSDIVVTSRDTIRAAMFPECSYTIEEKNAAYAAMKSAMAITLALGRSVCTDGMTFANQSDRDDMATLAREASVRLVLVHCDCPIPIAQARVAADTDTWFPDRDAAAVIEVASRLLPVPLEAEQLDMMQQTEEAGRELLGRLAALGRAG